MEICSDRYTDEEVRKKLKKRLDPKRFEHSLGVAYTAVSLMMAHGKILPDAGWDIDKDTEPSEALLHQKEICAVQLSQAYTAGLLHDCAKCIDEEESLRLCDKYHLELSAIERESPYLIHAKLGSVLAAEKYGVADPQILSAIRFHTTGRAEMTTLEAVIFAADFIEPNRKMLNCLPGIRSVIHKDLNLAVYMILKQTMVHLKNKGQPVEEHTLQALEWYAGIVEHS